MICPGCGSEGSGNFCANCGQRRAPPIYSIRSLVKELAEEQLSLGGKLPRTLRALFLQPGFLTREYLQQRISPYVLPFRLYLWISVIFFLAVAFQTRRQQITMPDRAVLDSVRVALRDTMNARLARGEGPPRRFGLTFDPTDKDWAANTQVNLGSDRLNRAVKSKLMTLSNLPPDQAIRRLLGNLVEDTPKVMFVLLPVYALLLKLLYFRSKRYYAEHFIFALHAHAFAFGVFLLLVLGSALPGVGVLLTLWLIVYFWIALRRVYREGWIATTFKWLLLGGTYAVLVAVALVGALVGAILTL